MEGIRLQKSPWLEVLSGNGEFLFSVVCLLVCLLLGMEDRTLCVLHTKQVVYQVH